MMEEEDDDSYARLMVLDQSGCPVREAILNGDRNLALQRIEEGANPFAFFGGPAVSAIQEASANGDIELLLAMAAEPGTTWTKRFLLCRKQIMDVPLNGRECIPNRSFFYEARYASKEGVEVMLMYGYKLRSSDFLQSICPQVLADPVKNLELLELGLAASTFAIADLNLEAVLRYAFRGDNIFPGLLQLARTLLRAGVNPNGISSYLDPPVLFRAIDNGDEDMTRLLVAFGADTTRIVELVSETGEHELVSIYELAEEVGMADLLVPPGNLERADPGYMAELRKKFEAPIKQIVPDYSALLVVAVMRATGCAPPIGLMSKLVLEYSFDFGLWRIET